MPKHLTIEPTSIAKQFAEALDLDDFATAESLLASECVYEARAGEIMGATAIVSSYREASAWAKDHLDSIQYASRVEDANESRAAVIFIDHITHQGKSHSYQCQQLLSFGANGNIVRIQHVELPGQREALNAFFATVGIARS